MKNTHQKRTPQSHEINAKQQKMLQQVQEDFPSKANHFKKAYGGSLRAAITAKCIECVWGETKLIRECPATGCPLYACRPYQEARTRNPDEKTKSRTDAAEVRHENKPAV